MYNVHYAHVLHMCVQVCDCTGLTCCLSLCLSVWRVKTLSFLRLHLMKMSQERCEATVKLLETDKGRLAKRCDELEQEVTSLQKAHDLAQKTRHTALEERTKVCLCAFIAWPVC